MDPDIWPIWIRNQEKMSNQDKVIRIRNTAEMMGSAF